MNEEPGPGWLRRLDEHFTHGAYTLNVVRRIMPLFELSADGLAQAVRYLMVRR